MTRAVTAALAVIAFAAALSGCGKQGPLDQPGPLWGDKAKANWAAQQAKSAEAKRSQNQAGQIEPLPEDNDADNDAANTAAPPP
jgi:predicted small lipoprotein YifL